MIDLISRQALCEYALNQKDKAVTPNDIMRFPSAYKPTGWIPVSERLPNEDGEYLVFYEEPITGSSIEIVWYGEPLMPNVDVSGKHFYRSDSEWGDIIYDEVIAWAPLPEPYRENGEEEGREAETDE